MRKKDFYNEIAHTPVPWRRHELHVPVFYPDFLFMTVSILAPVKCIRSLLPSPRLKPYRITPWQSTLSITAYRYRESDIGPYNEISVGVPVTLDEGTPLFTGSLRRMPKAPMVYIHHMPVNTEIAREVGAEFAGYPKFIADIEFQEEGNWLTCELRAENRKVLTLSGRKLDLKHSPRLCLMPLTYRRGYVLRSEFVVSEREMGSSASGKNVKLKLGEHPIAEELKDLNPGKIVSYGYCPQAQGILTPVFESYAG